MGRNEDSVGNKKVLIYYILFFLSIPLIILGAIFLVLGGITLMLISLAVGLILLIISIILIPYFLAKKPTKIKGDKYNKIKIKKY